MFAVQFGAVCMVFAAGLIPVWICAVFLNSFLEITDPDTISTRFVMLFMLFVGLGLIGLSLGGAAVLTQMILR